MIIKSYEIKKKNLDLYNIYLLYGKNDGLKKEVINSINKDKNEVQKYDQSEILENQDNFFNSIFSGSLFSNKEIIIIKRATDRLINIIEIINSKKTRDLQIIIDADALEKKSKLRILFEKDKKLICIPFYPDTDQTLLQLTGNFLRNKKIPISASNINLLVKKCNGDREVLYNELIKIEHYSKNGKIITEESISQLTNLIENFSVSELVDNCLAKNQKKTIHILNENNFSNDDSILIARTFLNKLKKILKLSTEFSKNNNIDLTISSAKPPIFWKDKEIVKQQIYKWKPNSIKELIYKLTKIELHIKKNVNNSVNLITDFIIEQST